MRRWCTVGQRRQPRRCRKRLPGGGRNAGGSVIRKRRRSSTARMMTGEGHPRTSSAIAWARRFGPGDPRTGRGSASSTAVRRWRTKRARRGGRRGAVGSCTCAAISRWRISHACATRRCGAGSKTTGGMIARRCIRSCVNWTVHWPAGPIGKTRSCVAISAGRRTGSHGCPGVLQGCVPTGRWACGVAPRREPYARRRSRTVLRGRGGETPPRYSPS